MKKVYFRSENTKTIDDVIIVIRHFWLIA